MFDKLQKQNEIMMMNSNVCERIAVAVLYVQWTKQNIMDDKQIVVWKSNFDIEQVEGTRTSKQNVYVVCLFADWKASGK